jgi:hypothetical protein
MVSNIAHALRRIKTDVAGHLEPEMIRQFCLEAGHTWRERVLDPVTTIHLFLLQILHGNTACNHLPHLSEGLKVKGNSLVSGPRRVEGD